MNSWLEIRPENEFPTRRAEEEKVANRAAGRGHSCEIHLIDAHNFPDGFSLTDDALVHVRLKL